MADVNLSIMIDDVVVAAGRRDVNAASVKRLADSIEQIGLKHPITVRRRGDKYALVAGRHRLEAFKRLGREHVPALIVTMNNDEARLWEIAENLHRADLSKLERDEQVAEWIKITERVSSHFERKPREGRPEGGVEAAARELGIERNDAHRAVQVASLSEEAKEVARDAGLDNNRSALLMVARETTPEAQVSKVVELAAKKAERPSCMKTDRPEQVTDDRGWQRRAMALWDEATPENRAWFADYIKTTVAA